MVYHFEGKIPHHRSSATGAATATLAIKKDDFHISLVRPSSSDPNRGCRKNFRGMADGVEEIVCQLELIELERQGEPRGGRFPLQE